MKTENVKVNENPYLDKPRRILNVIFYPDEPTQGATSKLLLTTDWVKSL